MSKKEPLPDMVEIGKRILWVRETHAGVKTQSEFAAHFGVTSQAVNGWESGKGIGLDKLLKIACDFGVSLEWLATGRGQRVPTGNGSGDYTPSAVVRDYTNYRENLSRLWNIFGMAIRSLPAEQALMLSAIEEVIQGAKDSSLRLPARSKQDNSHD